MNIIGIGSDRDLFQDGSGVQARALFYSTVADETHIIVFALRSLGLQEKKLSDKVFLYPTNSFSRFAYIFDACRIGKQIVRQHPLFTIHNSSFIISCQDPFEAGFIGWLLKRKFKLSLQLQIHTDFLNPYFTKESFLNRIRVLLAKFLIPRADCIRVVSRRIANSLQSKSLNLKSEIFVLPAFVDFQKIAEQPIQTDLCKKYPGRFIILTASRLTKEKNIGQAIQAMAEVVKDFPYALLLIVGDGPEQENLKSQILNLKIEEFIKIEFWTNDSASYYKTADILLVSSWYEGYGRTIMEALACGCPVASTKVGIAEEAIQDGENGFLVISSDAASIAQTLRKAIVVKNMSVMREKARASSVHFMLSPDEYLKRLRKAHAICRLKQSYDTRCRKMRKSC